MTNYRRDQKTPMDIAAVRSMQIDDLADRVLYRERFLAYRGTARRLWASPTGPLEVEVLGFIARRSGPVHEAALIEALASLRAEGVPL